MVSADNVNLDVLELVFSYLAGNDLASVALVSRSFCAGVIPRLYSTLLFRLSHAKRYPAVMSPFAAVAAHPEFAIHVRHVDIRHVPAIKAQYNPKFLLECTRALGLCRNITSFRCSVNALPPLFITALEQKDRLHDLRLHGNLTTEQSMRLTKLSMIRNLTLDFASWNLMNLLPKWTATMKANLTTLTLFMANDLNETVLGSALAELPNLLGLHVIGCSKVDHIAMLHLVSHTPYLESLSMTTSETSRPFPDPPASLPSLRNLALDTRLGSPEPGHPSSASVLAALLRHISSSSPRLLSFIVKYPDRQMALTTSFVGKLISAHATTLKNLSFIDCLIGTTDSLSALCVKCTALERLEVMIPVRDLTFFAHSLARSSTLRTLIDVEMHTHSPRPTLAQHEVRQLFTRVPSLRKIVSDGRIWTRRKDPDNQLLIGLERRPGHTAAIHWFMPRDI
ncbi:hypothetical protein C8F04DRAFT_1097082 [Mycena alexandri]|uniref:F-box domain-containing protein n=1 Tax=Mycena alexandri TaxID=1745969 RepID=A0AAD6SZY5_9AGAR|nr:hypothetical protein C8F04DRAFT_1097082 [Mycena alexandri]